MQLPYMVIMIGGTNMGQDRKKHAALLSARAREHSSRGRARARRGGGAGGAGRPWLGAIVTMT